MECFSQPVASVQEHLTALTKSLGKVHQLVTDLRDRRRAYNNKINVRKGAKPCEFEVGDYVLVRANPKKRLKSKIEVTFKGPFQVTKRISEYMFEVKQLWGSESKEWIHSRRLRYYMDSKVNVTELLRSAAEGDTAQFMIEKFTGWRIKKKSNVLQLCTKRLGYRDDAFDTWDDVSDVWEQDSELVKKYLQQ